MHEKKLEYLHKRNVLLCKLLWAVLVFTAGAIIAIGVNPDTIKLVTGLGGLIGVILTLLVWKRLFVDKIMYLIPIFLYILSFLLVNSTGQISNYMVVYFSLALVSLYHNFRPLVLAQVLGLIMTNWFYFSGHPVFETINTTNIGVLNLMFLIVSGVMIAQTRIGERSSKELVQNDQVLSQANARLEELVAHLGESAMQVATSAEQLTAGAEQTNLVTEHIASTINELSHGAERQVHAIEESSEAIQEISGNITMITEQVQKVAGNADRTEELASTGDVAIQTVVRQMNSINARMSELTEGVQRLGDRSQEIGQIVEVITGISAQTNLLALNAAIEAARAGEHGRGFAVVADEVRKLAEQSGQSAGKISALIETIQAETGSAITMMEAGAKEVADGIEVVNRAGQSFDEIRRSVVEVAGGVQEVSHSSQEMMDDVERVVSAIRQIWEISATSASAAQNVSAATEEQIASMAEIVSSAAALSKLADQLQGIAKNMHGE